MPRLGDYTVNGATAVSAGTAQSDYLFDSAVQAIIGASDFVIVRVVQTQLDTGEYETAAGIGRVTFDCQGDGGSGVQVVTDVGTNVAKDVCWHLVMNTLCLPASLFGTADATRTGRISANPTLQVIEFVFCSWNAGSNP